MNTQHTLGHQDCPACNQANRRDPSNDILPGLTFSQAAALWLRNRRGISAGTRADYADNLVHLNAFFGAMRLDSICIGHVLSYRRDRQEEIRASKRHCAHLAPDAEMQESDGASRINHEIGCLGQVLARAGLWLGIKRFYEPLPLPQSIGMALSCEEEDHLFAVARSRPRWLVAYCCGLISRNTTAGPGEIRHLRLGDIEMDTASGSFLHIEEGVKNAFRKRPVPLNTDARWAVLQLVDRAGNMGACEPQHCLLPHRARRRGALPDLERPMGSWKRAHRAMCREAAKKFPRLAHLRFQDYRHTAATDLLEDPAVSFTTIEHIMGHRISSHTKRKYDHLRNSALREAAEVLNRGHSAIAAMPLKAVVSQEYAGRERRRVAPQREPQPWRQPWTVRKDVG